MTSRHLARRMIRNNRRSQSGPTPQTGPHLRQLEFGSIAISVVIQVATIVCLILVFFGPDYVAALFGQGPWPSGGVDLPAP